MGSTASPTPVPNNDEFESEIPQNKLNFTSFLSETDTVSSSTSSIVDTVKKRKRTKKIATTDASISMTSSPPSKKQKSSPPSLEPINEQKQPNSEDQNATKQAPLRRSARLRKKRQQKQDKEEQEIRALSVDLCDKLHIASQHEIVNVEIIPAKEDSVNSMDGWRDNAQQSVISKWNPTATPFMSSIKKKKKNKNK